MAASFLSSRVKNLNIGVSGYTDNTNVLDVIGNITSSGSFISTIPDGTAPLQVISTTLVENLNVELLDGRNGDFYLNLDNSTGTFSPGDIIYAPSENTIAKLNIGNDGNLLTVVNGLPSWEQITAEDLGGISGIDVYDDDKDPTFIGKVKKFNFEFGLFAELDSVDQDLAIISLDLSSITPESIGAITGIGILEESVYIGEVRNIDFIGGNITAAIDVEGTATVTLTDDPTFNTVRVTVAPGTAPFIVNSNTLVSKLNADFLDGQHGSYYTNASNLSTGTVPVARLAGEYDIDISGNALTATNSSYINVTKRNDNTSYKVTFTDSIGGNQGIYIDEDLNQFTYTPVSGKLSSPILASSVAVGTAPLEVTSTTLVSNLNVDLLDNQHGSYYLDLDNATNVLDETKGGTGLDGYATGDILYASGVDTLAKLPIGTDNNVLYIEGNQIVWKALTPENVGAIDGVILQNDEAALGKVSTLSFNTNLVASIRASNTDAGDISLANDITLNSVTTTSDSTINGQRIGRGGGNIETNTVLGFEGLLSNTGGSNNVAIGYQSSYLNENGNYNVSVGVQSLFNNEGNNNTAFGHNALFANQTGNYNTSIGSFTGSSVVASRNIIIGSGTDENNLFDVPNLNQNFQMAIGHNVSGTSNYWIVGDENYNVGIGTDNPTAKLHVEGDLKVANLDYDYTNNGSVSGVDGVSFITGLKHPDGDSISNTTNTAGIVFLEGDIGTEVVSGTQYSGSFSIYTKNSTYDYCDNYINASPNEGMSFGASGGYNFYTTQTGGAGAPSVALTLSNTGNVGVGTNFPEEKLDIEGNVIVRGDLKVGTNLVQSTLDLQGSAFVSEKISINTTSQTAQVNVVGDVLITANSSTDLLRLTQTGTGNVLVVEDSTNPDQTSFAIDSDGNVGIKISNPQHSLDVGGDAKLHNKLYDSTDSSGTNGDLLVSSGNNVVWTSTANITAGDATNAANINITEKNDNVSYSVVFTSTSTGNQAVYIDTDVSDLVYNPSTGKLSSQIFISTIADGTAPLEVTSTTLVSNLNADLLDNQQGTYYLDLDNATNILDETKGGTSLSTYTTGDILYASAADTLSSLAIGSPGNILTVESGVPVWKTITAEDIGAITGIDIQEDDTSLGSVTTINFGTGIVAEIDSVDSTIANITVDTSGLLSGINVQEDDTSLGSVTTINFGTGIVAEIDSVDSTIANITVDASALASNTVNILEDGTSLGAFENINFISSNLTAADAGSSTATITLTDDPSFNTIELTVANGTAPLTVTSTTLVSNLNADLLDNQQGTYYLDLDNATNILDETKGGTSLSTYTTGDILYASATNTLSALAVGTENQVLTVDSSGVPIWKNSTIDILENGTSLGLIESINFGDRLIASINPLDLSSVNITFTDDPSFNTLELTVAVGTAPLTVTSTTLVSNLNADLLDGEQGTYYLDLDNATNILDETKGGTSLSTYTTGDILYASATDTLSSLAIGSPGNILTVEGGVPVWKNVQAGDVGAISGIDIQEDGTSLGLVTTINFGDRLIATLDLVDSNIANITFTDDPSFNTLELTVAVGTAPLTVTSTTLVSNLNADLLDNQQGTYYLDLDNATGTLAATKGGTGISTYAKGDIIYSSAVDTLEALALGTENQLLTVDATGVPVWKTVTAADLGDVSGVNVQEDDTPLGFVTTINFGTGIVAEIDPADSTIANINVNGTTRTVSTYTATSGQTTFSATYNVGYVDVFLNGAKLSENEYTATNGTSIVLDTGASLDDIVEVVGYSNINIAGGSATPDISPVMMGMIF